MESTKTRRSQLETRLASLERYRIRLTSVLLPQSRGPDSPHARLPRRNLHRAQIQIARIRVALRARPAPPRTT